MQCPKCGKQISNTATFCGYCGATITTKKEEFYETIKEESNKDNKTKNQSNSFIMILLCLLIAIVLGVGAFFIAKNCINNEPISINKSSEVKEIEVQDDETESDISFAEETEVDDAEENIAEDDNTKIENTNESEKKNTQEGTSKIAQKDDDVGISLGGNNVSPVDPDDGKQKLTISASSVLASDSNGTYYATNAFDGNYDTTWAEGVDGSGIGESISISFKKPVSIGQVCLTGGYTKNEDLFYANNWIKQAKVIVETVDGMIDERKMGYASDYTFKDWWSMTSIDIENITKVTLVIDEVYKGSQYDNTCITEILFYDDNLKRINLDLQ